MAPNAAPTTTSTSVMPPPPLGPVATPKKKDRRAALAASALVGALVLGGGAGFGGAALFYSTQDDSTRSGGNAATGSQVVNSNAPKGTSEKVAAKVLPSVVKIEVAGQGGSGSGSGIILSSDGLILTNNHVVDMSSASAQGGQPGFPGAPGQQQPEQQQGQSPTITVDFSDGTKAKAKVVGNDPLTDTAVIQAEGVSGLTPATIGKSSKLVVGQDVVAIGSPYGLDSTVTTGIVSALDRPVNVGSDSSGNATVYPAIQTDAAINPGNSGGALVDMNGNVVGINASIRSNSSSGSEAGSIGLGFAIPIDEVLPIIDQLKAGDDPTHARMGISVGDSAAAGSGESSGDSSVTGATVQSVTKDSAAEEAGLEKGDTITKVDAHQINGSDSLVATVRSYRPGDKVEVTWSRDGEEQSAKITLDSDAT
ncbi:putative serine protease PepD [Nocardioides albertanoniae]|uniref:Putative serine protease PepD n=1 Tax=Nocardioides albertanoniae TaxID=1175486 RepID=A0A543A3M5_9ACTN|nr:putative serine protease PepD [Nocardioides albertanoniae]